MTNLRIRVAVLGAAVGLSGALLMTPTATADVAAPAFGFPFAAGQQLYSAGIHSDNGNSGVKNALDLSPADGTVRAALAGTVRLQHCSGGDWVTVDHAGGWRTGYYHLEDIVVTDGQQVAAGTPLGSTGNALPCGGSSTGAHVHFTLWTLPATSSARAATTASAEAAKVAVGNWNDLSYGQVSSSVAAVYGQPIDGKDIGGWKFAAGAEQYSGTATRDSDGTVVQLPGSFRTRV
ncbi:M23 family metallopeptidase [Amycolatopsis sp. H20-H5]|uniref:M23 family metallopeptidase n=1 Tax=Amycolatopsis sp. H20-H5 TaxID=3046309 RepID=UPI002DBF15FF|nr:M23 family metallopeptidase [Amycolatopsis sp. H20-H5]MEC3977696.1 M23 family metallopeptidase [Amycolatopsis sp. H20-H5]